MKKQAHPIHTAMMQVLFIVLTVMAIITVIKVSGNYYSPMAAHMEYIQQYHNDKCTFEQGDCPQIECVRSEPDYSK